MLTIYEFDFDQLFRFAFLRRQSKPHLEGASTGDLGVQASNYESSLCVILSKIISP